MAKKNKLYEYKEINSRGANIHLARYVGEENWKFHRWDGPAIEPYDTGSEMVKSYYLNGIQYNYESYMEIMLVGLFGPKKVISQRVIWTT